MSLADRARAYCELHYPNEDGVGFFLGAGWAASLDPTDEEVLAALNALHPRVAAPSLDYWGTEADKMRAALLAAREVRR